MSQIENSMKQERSKRYWASRPDRENLELFDKELSLGNLRQGWGYSAEPSLNLNDIFQVIEQDSNGWSHLSDDQAAAYRNYPFHPKAFPDCFLTGDIVLVPNMPTFGRFSLVEVEDDIYRFEDVAGVDDYRHLRKVKRITPQGIPNSHPEVHAEIQSTLRCRSRIWRIDHLATEIEHLVRLVQNGELDDQAECTSIERYEMMEAACRAAAKEPARTAATRQVDQLMDARLDPNQFEIAVQCVLKKVFSGADISREGGSSEYAHGTDLLVSINNPFDPEHPFLIPVQVKKHRGLSSDGIEQLDKAAQYWGKFSAGGSGRVIALTLVNTGSLTVEAKEQLKKLEATHGVPCYHIGREQITDLFVSAALGSDWT